MERYLSPKLFSANLGVSTGPSSRQAYALKSAKDLGFKEAWLQNAICHNERLVIEPCEEAGLTDEAWWYWGHEVSTEAGPIDVLLVSESGRIGIVETKLHYNPQKRRSVLAQVLDYAVSLPTIPIDSFPELPADAGLTKSQVEHRIQLGDYLLIVAGDLLDARAVHLGNALLGNHILNHWELALVEVATFERLEGTDGPQHLLVPHLRGSIETELRQVVRFEGGRFVVQRPPPEETSGGREKWTQDRFFGTLDQGSLGPGYKAFGLGLLQLAKDFPDVELRWGTGKNGSLTLKRRGHGLVEFYLDGSISFRRERPPLALGPTAGSAYLQGLRETFPEEMQAEINPNVPTSIARPRAEKGLSSVLTLLRSALSSAA